MGSAVSKGVLATKVAEGVNGAGLVSARKAALPVGVGPATSQSLLVNGSIVEYTCEKLRRGLEVLGNLGRAARSCRSRLSLLKVRSLTYA